MTPILAQRLRTDRSFERLYRRYVGDVYRYAFAICRNAADAEDITQTTFMNAYRAVQSGQQPRSAKNWLLAIAHNVMRQRFRQAARRPDEVELGDAVAAAIPDEEGYSAEDIRRALGELAFNQRAALVMRELEGRSYGEIAEILSISVSAVETLIFRARRALREQLEGSLSCREAELAVSRQLDGRLSRAEKGALRAHLRTCADCSSFARSQRAQRAALKGLAAIPVPASLGSFFGGGAAVGTAVAAKAAAVTAVGLLVAGGGVETAKRLRHDQAAAGARAAAPIPTPSRESSARIAAPVASQLPAGRAELPESEASPPSRTAHRGRGSSGSHGRAVGRQKQAQASEVVAAAPSASQGRGRAIGHQRQNSRGAAKRKHGAPATARRTAKHAKQDARPAKAHGKGKTTGQDAAQAPVKEKQPSGKPADGVPAGNGGAGGHGKKSAAAVAVPVAGLSVSVAVAVPAL